MGKTQLFSTASLAEQWNDVAGPWQRVQARTAWRSSQPTVILTPSRAEGFYLRGRLVEEGVPLLGLRYWTPSDARQFLLAELSPEVTPAAQADLRLVARACAENLATRSALENATLASVIREPGAFLRAYDLLLGAGWDPARDGAQYGRQLALEMQRVLGKKLIVTQAALHRGLRETIVSAGEYQPILANLLVIGFNATHWPLWDLLQAIIMVASNATIALSRPRAFAEQIDQLWISSWEEMTRSEAVPPPGQISESEEFAPFSALVASYEQGTTGEASTADLTFLVTPDLTSHVRALVLQTLEYLKRDSCTRLGIVFAEANALALGVARELRRLGLPLNDGTGALVPGLFEERCWLAWLALQGEPGVARLIAWMRACEAQSVSCGLEEPLKARDAADTLEKAFGETLVDNLNFLALHLEETGGHRAGQVAEFLRRHIALPESATFSHFLELTRRAISLPGWQKHLDQLQMDPPPWLQEGGETISRLTFLEWLKESTNSQTRTRGAEGNHFYGKVHLTIYAQMTGQSWSHLILTGLNEGVWPRVFEQGAFGSRHELAALNQQARALNRRSVAEGGQGTGHETVSPGHGHCLLPLERQELALRDLCAALDSTRESACLAAMTVEGGRSLLPNDFFHHAFRSQYECELDEETFRGMATATEAWCEKYDDFFSGNGSQAAEPSPGGQRLPDTAATQIAYSARRDPTQPFGRFEFAFDGAPTRPIQLSCKRWEDAWHHPATLWLENIVGVSPWPEGTLSWSRAVGTWVHRWLAAALRDWQEQKATPAELSGFISTATRRTAQAAQRRARESGIELYPWWNQVWEQACSIALSLGETLAPHLPDRLFRCEFKLPSGLMIALPGADRNDFLLDGRVDLILIEPGTAARDFDNGDLSGASCWIVDFKTGAANKLTAGKIAKGDGLQPILYGLAARALGAGSTSISLHTVGEPLSQQVKLDAVVEIEPIFRSLEIVHRRGIFGMRADADTAYGYSPGHPIATRFIPAGILEAKWALVHRVEPDPSGEAA